MVEAPLDPQTWQAFFTPTSRDFHLIEHLFGDTVAPVALTRCSFEVLSSMEDVTWESFYAFVAHRGVVFAQEHDVFVSINRPEAIEETAFVLFAGHRYTPGVSLYAWSLRVGENPAAFFDFLLGLLARIEQADSPGNIIALNASAEVCPFPFSGPALEAFLTNANDNLEGLELEGFDFSKSHFLAMANAPASLNLHLLFEECKIGDSAAEAFLQCLQSNRGPTSLVKCEIETAVMVSALCGSKRLKQLQPLPIGDQDFRLLEALPENIGLELLDLNGMDISDDDWCALCAALATHPTLETLEHECADKAIEMSNESMARRMNAVAGMLRSNTILRDFTPLEEMHDEQIYEDLVVPRLEMNRTFFEVQCQAVKTSNLIVRPKLLGRALAVVHYNPKLIWKFLSQNVDAIVPYVPVGTSASAQLAEDTASHGIS